MKSGIQGELRVSLRYLPLWTAAGLMYFSQARVQRSLAHDPTPWTNDLATWMTGMYVCAALMPAVLYLSRRFPIERQGWRRRVGLHLLFSLLFALVELAAHSAILCWLGLYLGDRHTYGATLGVLLSVASQQAVITYWVIVGLNHMFRLYRRYQEREKQALRLELNSSELRTQLARAQLNALKSQLQPHFLFNTLNAIMVLVRKQQPGDAEEMLARLSDLLRYALDDVEAQETPLRRELEYVRLYLGIEEVRFGDRLRVEISADPAALDGAVPHMGLQPVVENAIRHGIGRRSSAGRIEIAAKVSDGALAITVRDDGPGIAASAAGGRGIGLANTRSRLEQLYGDKARLTLENAPGGGALATMVVPYRAVPGGAAETVESNGIDCTRGGR